MIVAAILIWSNLMPSHRYQFASDADNMFLIRREYTYLGWPWTASSQISREEYKLHTSAIYEQNPLLQMDIIDDGKWSEVGLRELRYDLEPLSQFSYSNAALNLLVGLISLAAVAMVLEYPVRRRARLMSSSGR